MSVESLPREGLIGARYFYFHMDDDEPLKEFWKGISGRVGIKGQGDDQPGRATLDGARKHRPTAITTGTGDGTRLSMLHYKNVVIVLASFAPSGRDVMDELGQADIPGRDRAVGESVLIIAPGQGGEAAAGELGTITDRIETRAGHLFLLAEKEGHKEHAYVLAFSGDSGALARLLSHQLPVFDFTVHKVHAERDYFRNQRKWAMEEKHDIDKKVGEILHKRIVGKSLNPENIELLEKEIETLSSKYAILVNDVQIIKKSRTVLEEDLRWAMARLRELGEPEGGEDLSILKDSEELKDRLDEDISSLNYSIQNTKTAIDTVRTNVELLRSRETILLQKEAISIQVAAGFVEFLIVFYYSLASWGYLLGHPRFDAVPVGIRFTGILLFSISAVVFTHFLGKALKDRKRVNRGMVISGAAIAIVFLGIVYVSFLPWTGPTPH
ncbi:MAG: hypothetical protein GXO65_02230 [Euryarchaeota archaeon]|nr:hypothetical protein [Euryarchaeota archaeon]